METWDPEEAESIVGGDMTNAEAAAEPPGARMPGVEGLHATYDWPHAAYGELYWTVRTEVADGDWVAARTTMSGQQTGPSSPTRRAGRSPACFPRRAGPSPPTRRTGTESPKGDWWSTTRTATTSAKPCSSAGSTRRR